MINISDEFKKYTYTFNRSLSSDIVLPYDKNSTLLGVNELVNGYNFNSSLDKLQSNLMYLYSVSKLADPDIPTDYEGYIGTTSVGGDKLEIQIKNFTPYDVAKAAYKDGDSDYSQMPYFTVTDEDNKSYGVFYGWDNDKPEKSNYNTIAGTLSTTLLSSFFIDVSTAAYCGNENAAYGAQAFLSAFNFQIHTFIFADGYPELYSTNLNPVIALSGLSPYGGVFFNNNKFPTVASFFGTEAQAMKYQQGTSNLVFSLHKNSFTVDSDMTIIDIPADIKSSGVVDEYAFNNLVSTSVASGNLSGFNAIFCCSPSSVVSLSAKSSASSLSADYTFTNYISSIGINNELPYQSINGSAYHDNSLYVSDTATNNVVKINVRGFTQNDNIRDNTFYETEIIGGFGGIRDNYSFNEPRILQFYKDRLYVYDKGNLCIKVYDKDLGYVRNLRKSGFAKSNPPISIKIYNDTFYWLTSGGKFFTLDNDLNLLKEEVLYNTDNTEYFTDFVVAENINMLYFSTKENIYKYYFDNTQFIGRFNLSENKIDKTELVFLSHVENTLNSVNLYAYGKRGRSGYLLRFNENDQYLNLLSNYDFEIYGKDEIEVDKNEFTANFAYNKSILKLLSNNLQFKNFITNMVSVSLRRDGGIDYNGVVYFNPAELEILNFNPGLDNYIGTNEIFSRSVVNRVLEKIYDYQTRLLSLFKNQVSPPPTQQNILSPSLNALMLEDYPGNWDGTYNTEQGLDFIELETEPVQQDQRVPVETEECACPTIHAADCCPLTPDSDQFLYDCDITCTPPCDLITTTFWVDEITTYVLDGSGVSNNDVKFEQTIEVHPMKFYHQEGLLVQQQFGVSTFYSKPFVPPTYIVNDEYTVDRRKVELTSPLQYFDLDNPYFSSSADPVKYIGNRTYTTINASNDLERDVTFNMYTVPDSAINIGDCWGWVGFDRSSYDWNVANNLQITQEAKDAGVETGLTDCSFNPEHFIVYFTKPPEDVSCGNVELYRGGVEWPYAEETVVLGTQYGMVDFWFNSFSEPDRFQVWFDDECVIDTGFVGAYSQRGSLTDNLRARLKKAIKDTGTGVVFRPKRDDDDLTYQLQNETDLGNIVNQYKKQSQKKDGNDYSKEVWNERDIKYPGYGKASFEKTTRTQTATVRVWAPTDGTRWKYTLWCPKPGGNKTDCGALVNENSLKDTGDSDYSTSGKFLSKKWTLDEYGGAFRSTCSNTLIEECKCYKGYVPSDQDMTMLKTVNLTTVFDYKGCHLYDVIGGNEIVNKAIENVQSPAPGGVVTLPGLPPQIPAAGDLGRAAGITNVGVNPGGIWPDQDRWIIVPLGQGL